MSKIRVWYGSGYGQTRLIDTKHLTPDQLCDEDPWEDIPSRLHQTWLDEEDAVLKNHLGKHVTNKLANTLALALNRNAASIKHRLYMLNKEHTT